MFRFVVSSGSVSETGKISFNNSKQLTKGDGSGTIECEEFLKMMTHEIRFFDDDETGKISFKNLKEREKSSRTGRILKL